MPHKRSVHGQIKARIRLDEYERDYRPIPEEIRLTREYCHKHSTRRDIDAFAEISEKVFFSTPEKLECAVLAELKGNRDVVIPSIPQGMVIIDIHGISQITNEKLGA